jgi:hypothetical protein
VPFRRALGNLVSGLGTRGWRYGTGLGVTDEQVVAAGISELNSPDSMQKRELCRRRLGPYATAGTAFSSSPNFARATNCPIPGEATSSPFSTRTLPRSSTTSGDPVTSVPS